MHDTITLIVGIMIGLVWRRRTGFSCGGIITPAILALHASPERVCASILAGIVLAPAVKAVSSVLDLYGSERVGTAMVMALLLGSVLPVSVGFVVPGLIACDIDRQGVIMTVCGTVSCTIIDIMLVGILS